MKIHSVQLVTKNNIKNGFYLYTPIVEVQGKFFWCKSVRTSKPIKAKDVDVKTVQIEREIPTQFYSQNNISK